MQPIIWDRYLKQAPASGQAFEDWVEDVGAELNIDPEAVRRYIADESSKFQSNLQIETRSIAQKVAHQIGLTEALVIEKIMEGLNATYETPLPVEENHVVDLSETKEGVNFNGPYHENAKKQAVSKLRNFKKGEDGQWIAHRQPDNKTRLLAARAAVDVLGMKTPEYLMEKVMQQTTVNIITLPEAEITKRLADVESKLRIVGGGHTSAGAIAASRRTSRAEVRKELPPVVDARYEDG